MNFYEFLETIRPVINTSALEKSAGIPKNTLGKHYRYIDGKPSGQKCPPHHFGALARALCQLFGCIKFNDWTIQTDGTILLIKKNKPNTTPVITENPPGTFEYSVIEYRDVLDDSDLQCFANQ